MLLCMWRPVDYVDPVAGASKAYTEHLAKIAELQEKTKAAERKRLWITAVNSVKRSTKTKNRLAMSSKIANTE